VTLISPDYDTPRSWRASLDWSTNLPKNLLFRAGTLFSYDLSQPGTVDANFSGTRKLTLADEASRPVFVSAAGIDPASGAVSAAESRVSSNYGRVSERVSDLHGYGGQFTLGLSPDVFKFRTRYSFYSSLNYTLQWSKRQFRGFDGAGFGDPRDKEWAPNSNDARQVIVFSGGFSYQKIGTITLFTRLQSGLPFTPIVQGDVNGDGRGGDRAFIPNPSSESDAALASQMRSLLENANDRTRDCLNDRLGRAAGRNSCRGPWTQSLNLQWRPPMPSKWGGRIVPNVYLQNILGRSSVNPDPVLLVPKGFDAGSSRFKYDVNSKFGTINSRSIARDPFRIVIDVSLNLSTNYDLQQLRRAVEPVKGPTGWDRRSADSLASFYLQNTSSIHKLLMSESDSLFITQPQMKQLKAADSVFSERVRAIYIPLGDFLSKSNGVVGKAELDSVKATSKKYWEIFWEQPEVAAAIITPAQRELMPMFARMLETTQEDRKHSQWQFGYPVLFSDKPKQ
jgi:hypothetical protein